ncbi:MAG: DUF4080 domain-containing protein [Defluviitaleaceae bacterium]|nr:DUF4080 domain-containing protein [Defluviitaleaceae bacterium]
MLKSAKKIILVAINAKFIHANLAIPSLIRHVRDLPGIIITALEFTTQDKINHILAEITDAQPDVVGFSCYIWNIEIVRNLVAALKKVRPGVCIILGGPEVSFDPEAQLAKCPADIVVRSEGEGALRDILTGTPLSEINGISFYAASNEIHTSSLRTKLPLEEIAFPYAADTLPQNKIIYYESSRGCPYTCGFCLSHSEKPVRLLPLARVFRELDFFLAHRVNQVKFVDRTLNCARARALAIWQYLLDNDNGHTNFHFEISADLLDSAAIALLQKAPEGLFQFEIGVQSTHAPTLQLIRRQTHTDAALANIRALKSAPHVHILLDLIAGLPGESFTRVRQSFNDVYALTPHMLQLGFLKLLKGSRLREEAELHDIVYQDAPPYEVLYTAHITYEELKILKQIEHALDILYNSGHFAWTVSFAIPFFPSAFDFYASFAAHWKENGYHRAAQSLPRLFEILNNFLAPHTAPEARLNLLRYDWYATGNQKSPPAWLYEPTQADLQQINQLYKTTDTPRRHPIVKFDFDPGASNVMTNGKNATINSDRDGVYLLFKSTAKPRPGAQGKCMIVTNLSIANEISLYSIKELGLNQIYLSFKK